MVYKRRARWNYRRTAKRRRTTSGYRRRSFRTYRRRRYHKRRIPVICNAILRNKMVNSYCYTVSLPSPQAFTNGFLNLNSVYDPMHTMMTGNTTGWAELSMLYDKMRVLGAKVRILVQNNTGYALYLDTFAIDSMQGNPPAWTYDFPEIKGVKRVIIPSCRAATSAVPGQAFAKSNRYISIRKLKGAPLDANDDANIRTDFDPPHVYRFFWYIGHTDGVGHADTINLLFSIRITQYVKWSQPSKHLFNH